MMRIFVGPKSMGSLCQLVGALAIVNAAYAATIEMVTVGNPGNAPDTKYEAGGIGSVNYVYQIGKYEVTAGQYTEFLNAVAKDDRPNGLYNIFMAELSWGGCNIQRSGSAPNYSYSVADDWANRPVNYVSFWDAVRFCNWLHNGQPTGPQGPATTEGGAYYLDTPEWAFNHHHPAAKFFLPTQDEWYKAAYHDKSAVLAATYFNYPTGHNEAPGRDMTESTNPGNNANYYVNGYMIGSPYYRTVVGEFELSASPYGTFDQGGNVFEWSETKTDDSARRLLGGSFFNPGGVIHRGSYGTNDPIREDSMMGFRIAGIAIVPEPSTVALCVFAAATLVVHQRRMRRVSE